MAVRDTLNRTRKYDSKLDPHAKRDASPHIIGKRYADLKESMIEEISASFARICEVEVGTKAVLFGVTLPEEL